MSTLSQTPGTSVPEGFVPLFEWQNNRDDGAGLMDLVTVERDGKPTEITNFAIIQDAFRDCIPPVKVHIAEAWSEDAKTSKTVLTKQQEEGNISSLQQFQKFVVGVYLRPNATATQNSSET